MNRWIAGLAMAVITAAPLAGNAGETRLATAARWYSEAEVARGEDVFATHCAACHGARGEGAAGWGERAAAPPPLNGAGHVSHHGLDQLLGKIERGGAADGGRMPAFGGVLSAADRRAALAWVQSLWPEAVFRNWQATRESGHHH